MMMLLVAGLTALISVNGAVSALIPVIVVIALRLGRPPSQLLMPLAFAAHAGSMLALTGTPVNIIVSDAARETGADGFGFFEFTIVGVPLLIGVIAIAVLFGERLLPHRTADALPPDLSRLRRRPEGALFDRCVGQPAAGDRFVTAGRTSRVGDGP